MLSKFLCFFLFLILLFGRFVAEERKPKQMETENSKTNQNIIVLKPDNIDVKTRLKINAAIEKGLNYLVKKQNKDGSWYNKIGYKLQFSYQGEVGKNVGVTAIAGLAFLAQGSTLKSGKYSEVIKKAVRFILSCQDSQSGYISKNGTRMYEHAFATLFLAEVYGTVKDKTIKSALIKAVNLILNSQNKLGGWRYQPTSQDADISVTVSTLQALRAARNAGIFVPQNTINKALEYIRKLETERGCFKYQIYGECRSFALTACGLISLMSIGVYHDKSIDAGIVSLMNTIPRDPSQFFNFHYFYGHYYTAQVMYILGGKYWNDYYKKVVEQILPAQKDDGSWDDDVGPVYATAMACIIMQIPNEYLPIFQK